MQVNLTDYTYHDRVIRFGTEDRPTFWPGWTVEGGTLVDLRLFPPVRGRCVQGLEPTYQPDALRKAGVPEALILEAAASMPMGFVLIPREAPNA